MTRDVYAVTVPLTQAPSSVQVLPTPCRLHGWSIADAGNKDSTFQESVAVGAGLAGNLTLTFPTSVAWFTVTPAGAWPAGVNQVTITNLVGGTQTFDIEGGTENPVVVNYSPFIGISGGNPVISVPAIAGGPAYTIDAEFTIGGAVPRSVDSVCEVFDSGQIVGVAGIPAGTSDTRWFGGNGVYVQTALDVVALVGTISGVLYVSDVHPGQGVSEVIIDIAG